MHRADAALAIGQPYHLAADLAVDGIEEWLERLNVELPASPIVAIEEAKLISLTATDADASWTIRGTKDGIQWDRTAPDRAADLHVTRTRLTSSSHSSANAPSKTAAWTSKATTPCGTGGS